MSQVIERSCTDGPEIRPQLTDGEVRGFVHGYLAHAQKIKSPPIKWNELFGALKVAWPLESDDALSSKLNHVLNLLKVDGCIILRPLT